MSKLNLGIIGFGTVGAGTYEVLLENRAIIESRVGMEIAVKKIADLDIESDRGVSVEQGLLTTDAMDLINDPEIDVIIELMGGLEMAREFILMAMKKGKHVVTANKALLAEFGSELYKTAQECGVNLAFEASVGGGIPIIGALSQGLSGNRILMMMGILNGTSNYVLTRMTQDELPYEQAIQEAVSLGYAEDPPTLDVNGTDAAHKLAILVSIIFGAPVSFDDIYRQGIHFLTPDDIRFAEEFGYRVKLLAIARDLGDRVEARVHPAMIPTDHILANVNEAYNAIYLEGDFVGPNLYYGLGAGRHPTGSAVASDIMELAKRIYLGQKESSPPLAHINSSRKQIRIQNIEELSSSYYFRVSAVDSPGVLSTISGILGENQISIASVIQKGREINGSVPIVMLTHEALESNVNKAISLLDNLDVLTEKTVMIRVQKGHSDGRKS
jgi:homoserine dehydrogenase